MKGVIEMASAVKRDGRAVVTTCGGCYADCAFAAHVEDGRVVAELPVPGHPCAARALCARGRHRLALPFDERDRILHPMRRRADGSGFDAVSWDEAFSEIAARLAEIIDEHGARALGMTLGVPSFDRYWAYRFMHALGSPNVYGADGACEVSHLTGWEHSLGCSPASDLAHTDCIMYLGRSIVDSSTMGAVDALNDARRRGAKIIVVDPRRSGSAALADRWLRVRPGCDLALLLGIAHVLIAENLYDHDFVARYTTGLMSWRRRPALGRPSGPSRCATFRRTISVRLRVIWLPRRLLRWWTLAFMAALASRMPIAPRPRARFVWSMCCWAVLDMRAVRSIRPHRLYWATWTLCVSRRRRCRVGPSWGPSAIHWSIRCAVCARPSVSRFLPGTCEG